MEKAAVRTTMRQVAQAISYTHQQGIVHRDIKPENVLLQDNGSVALCDFGISKDIISSKYESTMVMSAVGTAAYCAPEAGITNCSWFHCRSNPAFLALIFTECMTQQKRFLSDCAY